MKRVGSILGVFALLYVFGQAPPVLGQTSNSENKFVFPGFVVEFPGTQVSRDGETRLLIGGRMGSRTRFSDGVLIYETAYTPLSPRQAKFWQRRISKTSIRKVCLTNWQPLEQKKFEFQGFPAAETLFRSSSGSQVFRFMQLATNTHLYNLIVEGRDIASLQSPSADQFMNSFKLTEERRRSKKP